MSNTSQGPAWWQASDGRWYPPETHPSHQGGGTSPASKPGRWRRFRSLPTIVQVIAWFSAVVVVFAALGAALGSPAKKNVGVETVRVPARPVATAPPPDAGADAGDDHDAAAAYDLAAHHDSKTDHYETASALDYGPHRTGAEDQQAGRAVREGGDGRRQHRPGR